MDVAILVVNSIAALVAVVAAIIAICVYRKTATLQRKAIGYSILDDRIKVWKYLEHDRHQPEALIARIMDGRDWELEKFKLLFSEKLVKEYEGIKNLGKTIDDLATKIDCLEREGLPIRRDGDKLNNDDYNRYAKVHHNRKELQNKGLDSSANELVAFKALCQESFPSNKRQEYYDNVLLVLNRSNEQKKMLSTFLEHVYQEIEASLIEEKRK